MDSDFVLLPCLVALGSPSLQGSDVEMADAGPSAGAAPAAAGQAVAAPTLAGQAGAAPAMAGQAGVATAPAAIPPPPPLARL